MDSVTAKTGVQRLVGTRYGGVGFILTWHSLVQNPTDYLMQNTRCSVAHLRNTIEWAHDNGIDIVSLSDAVVRLGEANPRPFLVLTFDDGYRDNLTMALPVCELFEAPMTVYTSPGFVHRESFYWWGALVELIKLNESVEIPAADQRFASGTYAEKVRALGEITQWVQKDVETRVDELRPIFLSHGVDWEQLADRDFLDEADLRKLSGDPLVDIGSHSATHQILRPLPEAEARSEIEGSKRWLESTIDADVSHFCYPHGDAQACGPREARLVSEAGYQTAVSTRRGNLFPIHADAPFMLPRGSVNPNRESMSSISAQATGLPRCVESRLGPPIDPDTIAVRR